MYKEIQVMLFLNEEKYEENIRENAPHTTGTEYIEREMGEVTRGNERKIYIKLERE